MTIMHFMIHNIIHIEPGFRLTEEPKKKVCFGFALRSQVIEYYYFRYPSSIKNLKKFSFLLNFFVFKYYL